MLRQYVVGKITLTEEQISRCNVYEDYNSDGTVKINTRDVALLQQYIVGIIDTLGWQLHVGCYHRQLMIKRKKLLQGDSFLAGVG